MTGPVSMALPGQTGQSYPLPMATALVGSDAGYACPACGERVAELEDACDSCGSELGVERSVVEVWRGYTTATFIARTADELVAESPSFRCRGKNGPAESPAAQSALAALATQLGELGWSAAPDDGGRAWYELAFDRLVALAPVEFAEIEDDDYTEPAEPVAPQAPHVQWPPPPPLDVAPVAVEAPPEILFAPQPPAARKTARARGGRMVTAISIVGIAVACILGYVIAHRSTRIETRIVGAAQAAPVARTSLGKPAGAVPAPRVKAPLRMGVTATQDTWLELRRGSKSGPIVFSGILPSGKHLGVSGQRVWAYFAAAENADVTVDGRRVTLTGTLERLFTASGS